LKFPARKFCAREKTRALRCRRVLGKPITHERKSICLLFRASSPLGQRSSSALSPQFSVSPVATRSRKPRAQPAQPVASSPAPAAPAAPTGPVPSFSAANKVGLYAYPAKGQSHDQQLIDESDCYNSAQQQSGVNPDTPPPQPPSSADVQAAQAQAAESAPSKKAVEPKVPLRAQSAGR
jgi:hypothetical protein